MKIAFICTGLIPIDNFTLNERPLGGTETGIIRLAQELDQLGHEVTVFTAHTNPAPSTPRYVPGRLLYQMGDFDLMVAVQEWRSVFASLPTKRLMFLTGDGAEQFSNFGLGDARVIERLEALLVVSNFHRDSLCQQSGFPLAKSHVIGNGVQRAYFAENSQAERAQRLIYSSAPYRGLEHALNMFPKLRSRFPDLELHIFSSMSLYDREGPYQGPHQALAQKLERNARTIAGVVWHGAVRQEILAKQYQAATIFFYPCTVPETCCISVLEAQAAGCVPVTSQVGALVESVADTGITLPGNPAGSEFQSAMIEQTSKLLNDANLRTQFISRAASRTSSELGWDNVAQRFLKVLS